MSASHSTSRPVYRRIVQRPPWCPGDHVPHVCNCGVRTVYEPAVNGLAEAHGTLPPQWYRGASPQAIGFWSGLVVKLSLGGAHAFAGDALAHGYTLASLYDWCVTNGFAT